MNRLAAFVVFLAFAIVGCSSGSNDEAGSSPPPPTPTTTTNACEPLPGAAFTKQLSPAIENRETMYLTDVSLDSGECTDTVVFDFEEQEPGPGFEVSYQPASSAKIEDGSGNPVAIDGGAFLVVRLTPAMTAKIDGEEVTKTYTGPRRLPEDPSSGVRDVVKTGDFEALVTWVIGVDKKWPFTTNATDSQLVVEIDRGS